MIRTLWLALVVGLLWAGGARAQLTESGPPPPLVPAYVPRTAALGLFVGEGANSWQARLGWEVNLIQQSTSDFILVFEGGGGYAFNEVNGINGSTLPMTFFYQYMAQGGAGYRGHYSNGFNWGFQATVGALWYGARFGGQAPTENLLIPGVEGWAQAGLKVGPVVYGVRIGVAQPLDQPIHSLSITYVGGFTFGFFAEWR